MASFTPGPWHRNIKPASKYPTVWSGRNTHVARVVPSAGMPEAEVEANIALIVAAPDLLEALQAIGQALHMGFAASEILDENSPIRNGIRAAIAKATGAQP